jgi:hypothetical protein
MAGSAGATGESCQRCLSRDASGPWLRWSAARVGACHPGRDGAEHGRHSRPSRNRGASRSFRNGDAQHTPDSVADACPYRNPRTYCHGDAGGDCYTRAFANGHADSVADAETQPSGHAFTVAIAGSRAEYTSRLNLVSRLQPCAQRRPRSAWCRPHRRLCDGRKTRSARTSSARSKLARSVAVT